MPVSDFRSQLDSILRSKNPEAVRQFLVAQGQWPEDATADAERAMWLMIAGSPALRELHAEAHHWLIGHGAQAEAEMLLERESKPQKSAVAPIAKARDSSGNPGGKKRRPNTATPKHPQINRGPDHPSQPHNKPPKQT